jgi:hypothetical protein
MRLGAVPKLDRMFINQLRGAFLRRALARLIEINELDGVTPLIQEVDMETHIQNNRPQR